MRNHPFERNPMKNELRNLGLFLITPFPQKYHFEGVNNVRASKQLLAVIGTVYVGVFGTVLFGGAIKEKAIDTKNKLQSKKNK